MKLQPVLTSKFCDYRAGHFHAGLDLRTNGRPGYRIYAVDNGHIFRLSTSFGGYGKALYLITDDGRIAVYGHLSSFGDQLDEMVRKKQIRDKRYNQNIMFTPSEYRVKKGQVLGLSGASGSGAPHLHFELRSKDNNPINPLRFGFHLQDKKPPVIEQLGIRYYSESGFNPGDPVEIEFLRLSTPQKSAQYVIPDTIVSDGYLALAVSGGDRVDGREYVYGYYGLRLYLEDSLIFIMNSDSLSYQTTGQLDYIRDLGLNRLAGKTSGGDNDENVFYRLYVPPAGRQYFWEGLEYCSGLIPPDTLPGGIRRVKVAAYDEVGNETELVFYLKSPDIAGPRPEFVSYYRFADTVEVDFLTFDKIGSVDVEYRGKSGEPYENIKSSLSSRTWNRGEDIAYLNTFRVISPYGGRDYRFHCQGDSAGITPWIYFTDAEDYSGLKVTGGPDFLRITYFPDSIFSGISLSLQNSAAAIDLDMIHRGLKIYSADIAGIELSGLTDIIIKGDGRVVVDTQIVLYPVYPDRSLQIYSPDSMMTVSFDSGSAFYPVYVTPSNSVAGKALDRNALIFDLEPWDMIADKPIRFSFNLAGLDMESDKTGAYGYIPDKDDWGFIGKSDSSELRINGFGLGKLALLKDADPPTIDSIRPRGRTKSRRPLLSCAITDNISGVAADSSLFMAIDGFWVPAEYDSDTKTFRYQVKGAIKPGAHKIEIRARDNQGNLAVRSSVFTVTGN